MKYKWLIIYLVLIALALGVGFYLKPNPKFNFTIVTTGNSVIKATKIKEKKPVEISSYQIPVLMYHYIRVADPADTLGVGLSVTPTNFEKQMKWLSENNYKSMKLEDLADPEKIEIGKILNSKKKPVVITFDDGYEDSFTEAYPILKKYNFTGTIFIIRDFVGRSEYANQNQINEIASNGMEIGSHTLGHKNLATSSLDIAKTQIFDSKLGSNVFCYPSGRYNEDVVSLVRDAGYDVAVTTNPGIATEKSNILELPRVRIKNVDLETFSKKVQGLE